METCMHVSMDPHTALSHLGELTGSFMDMQDDEEDAAKKQKQNDDDNKDDSQGRTGGGRGKASGKSKAQRAAPKAAVVKPARLSSNALIFVFVARLFTPVKLLMAGMCAL